MSTLGGRKAKPAHRRPTYFEARSGWLRLLGGAESVATGSERQPGEWAVEDAAQRPIDFIVVSVSGRAIPIQHRIPPVHRPDANFEL